MKSPRSPEELEGVRRRILDVALELLSAHGFEGFTLRSLGRSLEMTAPNLYNYFSGKDEIYLTLMTRGFEQLGSALRNADEAEGGDVVRARRVLMAYLDFGLTHSDMYRLMFGGLGPKYRDFKGTEHEGLSVAEHALSMQIAEFSGGILSRTLGRGTSDDPTLLVGVWSLLHGMVSLAQSGNVQYLVADPTPVFVALVEGLTRPEWLGQLAEFHREGFGGGGPPWGPGPDPR